MPDANGLWQVKPPSPAATPTALVSHHHPVNQSNAVADVVAFAHAVLFLQDTLHHNKHWTRTVFMFLV